jgi:hypothetical protein
MVHTAIGTIESGTVRFERGENWREGQRVLVIALPADGAAEMIAPPADLLDEDARELATRPEVSSATSRDDLT